MSIFFDRYSALCKERGESPNSVAKKLGFSSGSITAWKRGTMPRIETVNMLASFFNVSADYLLGNVSDPFFYLDNDRIKAEINSYEDTPEKKPAVPKDDELTHAIILGRNGKAIRRTYSPEDMEAVYRLLDALPHKDEDI